MTGPGVDNCLGISVPQNPESPDGFPEGRYIHTLGNPRSFTRGAPYIRESGSSPNFPQT